jgi:sulfotransferase
MDEATIKELIQQEVSKQKQPQTRTYYFMSGLPRAGSTLLSSLLNQNPRFHSGPSSPVVPTMLTLENSLSQDELFMAYPKPEIGRHMISSVLPNYYADVDKPVIFDKNRSWVNRMNYIEGYFGIEPKILCPVRNIDEILTSFISLQRKNVFNGEQTKINFIDEMLIKSNIPLTDDNRCEFIASPMGILGQSYGGIQQAVMEGRRRQLHFIEYDNLMDNPEETMRAIYDFLEEEYFEHNFTKIENIHKERDMEVYGMEGMHDVRNKLSKTAALPEEVLTEETLNKCHNMEFWRIIDEEFVPPEDGGIDDYEQNDNISSGDQSDTSLIGG